MNYNNCFIYNKISYICRDQWPFFLNKPYVVGVGLGYKMSKGFYTNEICITVFVTKKRNKNSLKNFQLIPLQYKGLKTDVRECGIIKPQNLTGRIRPVLQGYSIGTESGGGTTGCLVTDGNDIYVLSCNHVLANLNKTPIGAKITQPSILDGGKIPTDVIAELYKYIPLKFKSFFRTPTNYVDCAIGKVLDRSLVSPKLAIVGNIKGVGVPKLNDDVMKVAKTSGFTTGIITNTHTTMEIDYRSQKILFKDQIITNKMSLSGDSGGLLLSNTRYALGLLSSSSATISISNPIDRVLQKLGVTIVTS